MVWLLEIVGTTRDFWVVAEPTFHDAVKVAETLLERRPAHEWAAYRITPARST